MPGSPDWPLSEQDREIKFLDCAGRAIGPQGARALLDLTRRTRELPRIAELTAAATPHGRVAELKRA